MSNAAQIKKVLISGTANQRILLLANQVAAWANPEGLKLALTNEEFAALEDSFKTELDLRIYRKFQRLDEIFRVVIMQLSQLSIEFDLVDTKFRLFNMQRRTLENIENLLGTLAILVSTQVGEKKQITIWKEFLKNFAYEFPLGSGPKLRIEKEEDGKKYAYIDLTAADFSGDVKELLKKEWNGEGESFTYAQLLKICGEKICKIRQSGKTQIEALREVIDTYGFNVKPYKQFLDNLEKKLKRDFSITYFGIPEDEKLVEELDYLKELKNTGGLKEFFDKEEEIKRLFLTPYEEIEINQNLKKETIELFDHKAIKNGPK